MQKKSCNRRSSINQSLVFGILLISAGLLFLSFNFGWIDPALRWVIFSWPMIFIVLSVVSFSRIDFAFGLVWLIAGLFFLIPRIAAVYPKYLNGINSGFSRTYWPLLLVILGIIIIFRISADKNKSLRGHKNQNHNPKSTQNLDSRVNKGVTFSGSETVQYLEV